METTRQLKFQLASEHLDGIVENLIPKLGEWVLWYVLFQRQTNKREVAGSNPTAVPSSMCK